MRIFGSIVIYNNLLKQFNMSELPYAATNGGAGLYSIEEQEQFYAHLFDHSNDMNISAITNMID